MFEAGKEYKTRGGMRARVYATDGKGVDTIHGAVFDGGWVYNTWRPDGRWTTTMGNDEDLMPPLVEGWMNVYSGESPVYPTDGQAIREGKAHPRYVKTIKVREVANEQ